MRPAFARARMRSRAPARRYARRSAAIVGRVFLAGMLLSSSAYAQQRVAIKSDMLFYGDNTEFRNPFREGETIFGAALRVAGEIDLNDRVSFSIGGFANQRFGSEDAFELVRPVLSLTVRGARASFVFGTLPPPPPSRKRGPDLDGPHELLPPLQRETLAFDRPYEAGLAWNFESSAIQHRFWLEWQRLNTPEHRERFDGGTSTSFKASELLSIPFQLHVVHQGGQLYPSGPVADSAAAALGVDLHSRRQKRYLASVELLGLVSRFVPDRSIESSRLDGTGLFGRVALEDSRWRGHVIFWRGRNFIKDEGDPNYMSVARGDRRYKGTRDYAEAGLTRRFALAPSAVLDVSGRLHRVEGRYEYSFRIQSRVSASWKVH